jgi:hypothetical protein
MINGSDFSESVRSSASKTDLTIITDLEEGIMTPKKSIVTPITSRYADESLHSEGLVIMRRVSPKRITALLACLALLLILAGIASKYARFSLGEDGLHQYHIREIARQFDPDEENNLASYYQIVTLQFCALLLALTSWAKRGASDRYYLHWRALALIFLLLSVDEAASLHEATAEHLRGALHMGDYFHFAWVVPAIVFVLIVAISYLRFLLSLPAGTGWLFVIAGAFYVGGAVGMEIVGGHLRKLHGEQSPQYAAGTVAEEVLEIIGVWIFIYALLSYLSRQVKELRIEFEGKKQIVE